MYLRDDTKDEVLEAAKAVALAVDADLCKLFVYAKAIELASAIEDARFAKFEEILDATELVPDEEGDISWDIEDECDLVRDDEAEEYIVRKGLRYAVRPSAESCRELVRFYRERGASRGVAWQLANAESRRIAQESYLRYYNPRECLGVVCDFAGCTASCWGYDCEQYAKSQRREIADEVAEQLVADGWTIEGRPDWKAIEREERVKCAADRFRRGAHMFDMK